MSKFSQEQIDINSDYSNDTESVKLPNPEQNGEAVDRNNNHSAMTSPSVSNFEKQPKNSPWLSGNQGLVVGTILGVLLTGGMSRIFDSKSSTPSTETDASKSVAKANEPARAVTAAIVKTAPVERFLNVSGSVAAYEEIPVMSQATGLQVTQIFADRGDFVSQGQIVAKLNDKMLQAEKIQAEAEVAKAQASLDELQAGTRSEEIARARERVNSIQAELAETEFALELVQKRVQRNRALEAEGAVTRDRLDEILNQERISQANLRGVKARLQEAQQELAQLEAGARPQTIDRAAAELAQARGRLQLIEARLEDTNIVAPASGIISDRNTRVGDITSGSESLFSIIENGRLELRLNVPETLVGQITPGQKVKITSDANSSLQLSGRVREIDPTINDSRQATVKVDLPKSTNLKPGMFLNAGIVTDKTRGTSVPVEALLPQSGNSAIAFTIEDDNTVTAQNVTLGEILSDRTVEVTSGLTPGDRIVLKGAAYLKNGDLVTTDTAI